MGFVLLVLCSGHSMDMDKPPGFFANFKSKFPCRFKRKYHRFTAKVRSTVLTDTIFDPYYLSLDLLLFRGMLYFSLDVKGKDASYIFRFIYLFSTVFFSTVLFSPVYRVACSIFCKFNLLGWRATFFF